MGFYPFLTNFLTKCSMSETNQGNAPVFKLDFLKIKFQMYNLIFGTSSYSECGLRKKKFGTRVPCEVLEFMELKFHLNFFKELEFKELEFQI